MKIIRFLLIIVTALVIALLVYAYTLPEEIVIKRKVNVNVPQQFAYDYLIELKNWEKWTPWEEYDSTLTYSYTMTTVGEGAEMRWDGEDSEKASLMITKVKEPEKIDFDLKWSEGETAFQGYMKINKLKDTLVSIDWVHYKEAGWDPFMRLLGTMLENMMGPNFEKGLSNLKKKLEYKYRVRNKEQIIENPS